MNERINALKEQAFDTVWDLDKTTIGPSTHFVPDGFEQKFAELIVRDCYSVIIKSQRGYFNPATSWDAVKEHFGVEE